MKISLTLVCCYLFVLFCCVLVVVDSKSVGLYAPDRYDGVPDVCLMQMDFGHCHAKVKRFYFDMRRMKCAMFFWGGCAGNENNFNSMEQCNDYCLENHNGSKK